MKNESVLHESTAPDASEFARVTHREWQVVSEDGDGISFTVNYHERDSQQSAARYVRPGTNLVLAEYEQWVTPQRLVSRQVVDVKCPRDVGKRPSWMSPDQYDPCPCTLSAGHEPPCVCRHGDDS